MIEEENPSYTDNPHNHNDTSIITQVAINAKNPSNTSYSTLTPKSLITILHFNLNNRCTRNNSQNPDNLNIPQISYNLCNNNNAKTQKYNPSTKNKIIQIILITLKTFIIMITLVTLVTVTTQITQVHQITTE